MNSPKSKFDKARDGYVCIVTTIWFADVEQTKRTKKMCSRVLVRII
jgi:hypothetical protein